ncbi:MAG: type VI secretion system-associated FHA domain protein TagH [Phenylobacterium sp.]|uniref:type VI secretion system-associated FHA domain protein TagH n=1 Tax=Phenylobacterium sp. TaxID=1871053 RepID=UPI002735E702|nr:type VI secretion system-associated FHA domain protein TagH [Phenylobacterium sp.]MDP3747873.1 type VI secretion system-associated FHA domain protein TagH [Phenylobacterium sp.]
MTATLAQPKVSKAVLRLFRQSDPFQLMESRELTEGELVIGRDAAAGWTIADPERSISRNHCVIALRAGRLTLRDTSSNGVFVGARRDRLPPGEPAAIEAGDTLRLGGYLIVVEAAEAENGAFDAPFSGPMLKPVAITEATLAVPSAWTGPEAVEAPSDGSLLDAFCNGARLDASAFSGEDPVEVMRRLGAVYQQMVLGLGDLMSERTSVKTEYRMTRTTVRAEGNNPFKWAPAQRVAADLLRPRGEGFLSGPAAVKASFQDMKKHLLCMMAGLRAAVGSTLEALAPEEAEARLKGQSLVLKNRDAMAFGEYVKLHAEFRMRADGDPDSPVNQAFKAAYERQLTELDAMSTQA